jgi:hypothetical protein
MAARSVAVDIYNKLGNAELTAALLDLAIATSRSTATISQFAAEIAKVRYQYHSAAAVAAFDQASWALAAAHAEGAEEFAPSSETQAQMRALGTTASQRTLPNLVSLARSRITAEFESVQQQLARDVLSAARFVGVSYPPPAPVAPEPARVAGQSTATSSRGRWIAAGIVVAILAAMGIANANTKTATPSPSFAATAVPRTTQLTAPTVAPVSACRAEVRAMDNQLNSMETSAASLDSKLTSLRGQIDSLRGQINQTESLYPRGIPSALYPSYADDVSRLNRMVDDYNSQLATYKSQVADYNALLDRRNARNRTC